MWLPLCVEWAESLWPREREEAGKGKAGESILGVLSRPARASRSYVSTGFPSPWLPEFEQLVFKDKL